MELVLDFDQSDADDINIINQQLSDRACMDLSTDTYSVHLITKNHTPKLDDTALYRRKTSRSRITQML